MQRRATARGAPTPPASRPPPPSGRRARDLANGRCNDSRRRTTHACEPPAYRSRGPPRRLRLNDSDISVCVAHKAVAKSKCLDQARERAINHPPKQMAASASNTDGHDRTADGSRPRRVTEKDTVIVPQTASLCNGGSLCPISVHLTTRTGRPDRRSEHGG